MPRLHRSAARPSPYVGEVASTEVGGSKAAWITDLLGTQLSDNYPRVGGVMWFDKTGSEADNMDWTIGSSVSARVAFAAGIADPAYQSNNYATLGGSTIPAP